MDTKTEIQAARVAVDPAAVLRLGAMLGSKFEQYEKDRRLAELKWAKNVRQFIGIYDPDIESTLDVNRSRAYPKLTRVKCVSMLSRLMNLLFQNSDKCWGIAPSAVPELETQVLQAILDNVQQIAAQQQREPTDAEIEQAIREVAKKRAERLELEIEDQLQELGGARTVDFVSLCRKVLMSGIQFGMGVLKGPFVEDQKMRRWKKDPAGRLLAETYTAERPRFSFVSMWDYYPDMSAKTLAQMDGQFERVVMSKHQLMLLKERPDFLSPQIDIAVQQNPSGNYKRRAYEMELRAMGVQSNVTEAERGKYEAIVWEGNVSGQELHLAGARVRDEDMNRDVRACVWMVGGVVIKADTDSWVALAGEQDAPPMYHHFIFEDDESTLLGNALPNIVRDSQMGMCAGVRMTMDNGSVACGINMEVNTVLLRMDQDVTSHSAFKTYYRDDDSVTTMGIPAVRAIDIPSKIPELAGIITMFSGFADQETFVGPATGGDMAKGPSEPFRSAAGASMIRGDAALPFKDVVRNFDMFTLSVMNALILFNKQFNPNPALRGDFQPIARGATSLLAKEVLGMQLDQLASTLTDEEKLYVDAHELLRARVRVRDLEVANIVVDDAEAKRREQAQQEQQREQSDMQRRLMEAQIREILAATLKDISQAGKNAAASEAATANVILNALEKGISPNALANTTEGGGADPANPNAQAGDGGAVAPGVDPASGGQMPGQIVDASNSGLAAAPSGSADAGFPPIPDQSQTLAA